LSLNMPRIPDGDELNGQDLFPVFLKLKGKRCLVVGGGKVAYRKILDLLDCGADITAVAEDPNPECTEIAEQGKLTLLIRRFRPEDIEGISLVFAATGDDLVNVEISDLARSKGILANVVDDPEKCDFFSGSVVKRGHLQIAISTGGSSPSIAQKIRRELEERYSESYGDFIDAAGEMRKEILASGLTEERKRLSLQWLASEKAYTIFMNSGKATVWEEVRKILFSS
jgi:precorrin-2 dehydrogenase / sirohydrochlorin ferrochelatase